MFLLPWSAWAVDQLYCPQHSGYINIGMTQDQVLAACGEPLSKQDSNTPIMQKVPMQQLFYNNQGAPQATYGRISINVAANNSGAQLQVNVVNNKVSSIIVNGGNSNAFSICGGTNVEVGDPINKVYNACGAPALVNKTYINQPIPSVSKPQIWTYKPDQYQPTFSLTFVDGKLQSID
jgi:hypothetical protein